MQDEERAAKSLAAGSQTTGSIQRPVRWFVDITSWEPIAMDMRQLVRAFDAGRVDADTLVWRKGMPDWRRLRDISELAERLVGAGGDASEKTASEPPPAELSQSNSEPPPRQSERSRTPPASYTVGARSGSEPPAAPDGVIVQGSAGQNAGGQTVMSQGSFAAVLPESAAIDSVAPPVAEFERMSVAPATDASVPPSRRSSPNGSTRPHSRRGRSKTPSRPNASAAPVPSRTVTQTGLESPAEVTARNSIAPPAGAVSNSDGVPARTRDSRTSAAPPGPRRQASSDETPAQKPSSLSVPPGAMVEARSRPRGRRFLAIAAVVLGGAFLLKQVATGGDDVTATAAHRVDALPAHEPLEKAPERKAAAEQPMPGVPAHDSRPSTARGAGEPHPAADGMAGSSKVAATTPAAPATPAALPGSAAPAPGTALNVEASAKETVGPVGVAPPVAEAPKAAARETALVPPPVAKPASAAPAAAVPAPAAPATLAPAATPAVRPTAAPVAAAPPPAPKPLSPVVGTPSPAAVKSPAPAEPAVAREPRPFDEALATQQFQAAVAKASACGQQGSTRGTGRVKVAIEPWGRVGRVTHLNQEFVGTPVGLCIMQVFQEMRVPPFDGNSRSIAGEFLVE